MTNITNIQKYVPYALLALVGVIVFGGVFFLNEKANAQPPTFLETGTSIFSSTTPTDSATTSPSFMEHGIGTTTSIFDAYVYGGISDIGGGLFANLQVQLTASSTFTEAIIEIERSNDGIDWYRDTYSVASTSIAFNGAVYPLIHMPFASSTRDGSPYGAQDTMYRSFKIPIATRYTRATTWLASSTVPGLEEGVDKGAIWQEWIGFKSRF